MVMLMERAWSESSSAEVVAKEDQNCDAPEEEDEEEEDSSSGSSGSSSSSGAGGHQRLLRCTIWSEKKPSHHFLCLSLDLLFCQSLIPPMKNRQRGREKEKEEVW